MGVQCGLPSLTSRMNVLKEAMQEEEAQWEMVAARATAAMMGLAAMQRAVQIELVALAPKAKESVPCEVVVD